MDMYDSFFRSGVLSIFEFIFLSFFTIDVLCKPQTFVSPLLPFGLLFLQVAEALCSCTVYAQVLHGFSLLVFCRR